MNNEQLLKRIEELEKEVKRLNYKLIKITILMPSNQETCEQYKWISVKDQLPEPNDYVLCYGPTLMAKYVVRDWMDYTNQDSEWFKTYFTHWMPIHKPPTE